MDDALLDEVTSLVEWPVAYLGHFNDAFLKTPKEALIASMKVHQRCFPVVNNQGMLKPYFVIISNLDSKKPQTVIEGNARVINARLADAAFFYQQDIKQSLESRLSKLKVMTFQEKLGSMSDRVKRLEQCAEFLAKTLHEKVTSIKAIKRAAKLSKSDLASELVYEFPELQGTAGYYYAIHDQESTECAIAIRDHYKPCFSGDTLPDTMAGQILSMADKIDLLISIIGLNQIPTGDKDPFALRRAALGIIRISIEKGLSFDLLKVLEKASKSFHPALPNKKAVPQAFDFITQRLKAWYLDQGISPQQFMSVRAVNPTNLVDFDARLKAVATFVQIPEAKSLSIANKRVMNILKKQKINMSSRGMVDPKLFEVSAEKELWKCIKSKSTLVERLSKKYQYEEALTSLAELKTSIDCFFEDVFVMVKNKQIQKNRLTLLVELRKLLTMVADIAYLSSS
jgi:glycyl-tRNA synthetase beta chain